MSMSVAPPPADAAADAQPRIAFRAMRRDDLPEASAMFARVMGVGAPQLPGAERAVERFFADAFFDCPWADPEISPLVAHDATGAIVGMIGAETRRLRFEGRVLRVASAGFLAVVPEARNSATGVLLLRRLLGGPQDLTVTDTASELVEKIWLRLGGSRVELKEMHWVSITRPWSIAAGLAAAQAGRPAATGARGLARDLAAGLDGGTTRVAGALLPARPSGIAVETLTPELLLEHLPAVAKDHPHADYDSTTCGGCSTRCTGCRAAATSSPTCCATSAGASRLVRLLPAPGLAQRGAAGRSERARLGRRRRPSPVARPRARRRRRCAGDWSRGSCRRSRGDAACCGTGAGRSSTARTRSWPSG